MFGGLLLLLEICQRFYKKCKNKSEVILQSTVNFLKIKVKLKERTEILTSKIKIYVK